MSPNLDLVRSIYADWERGDFGPGEWAHPEIEISIADGPAPGTWTGPTGMTESFRDWASAWKDLRVEAEGFRELDDERVLVLTRRTGRGRRSGLELAQIGTESATIVHVQGGKVTRLVYYWDRDRALADLGLAPEGDSEASS